MLMDRLNGIIEGRVAVGGGPLLSDSFCIAAVDL